MFQFPGFPTLTYGFSQRYTVLHRVCSHIRKSADRSLFAAPRGLSQLVTSFFGSWCQGIHLTLLFAWTSYTIYSVLLELSEFLLNMNKHIQGSLFLFAMKGLSFTLVRVPPFGEIVLFPLLCLERQMIFFYLSSSVRFYSNLSSIQLSMIFVRLAFRAGRSGWTRTIDLSVISRVL